MVGVGINVRTLNEIRRIDWMRRKYKSKGVDSGFGFMIICYCIKHKYQVTEIDWECSFFMNFTQSASTQIFA